MSVPQGKADFAETAADVRNDLDRTLRRGPARGRLLKAGCFTPFYVRAVSPMEGLEMRQVINSLGAMVVLCNLTASHAENARPDDPIEVTRSFLGAWATSSVDELMRFMAIDAVVVGS